MIINNKQTKNGRICCVHFLSAKFAGFSLMELLVVISILMLLVPAAFTTRAKSEERQAIEEARRLANWLEHAFIRSNVTKQRFRIIGSSAVSQNFHITWISASSTQRETYESGGRALFQVPAGGVSDYNPLLGYLEGQLGMTIRVYRGSDTRRSRIIRYVIISRFGRVRVSEFPP